MGAWLGVKAEAEFRERLEVLPEEQCAALAASVARAFVADQGRRWWWEALRQDVPMASVSYEGADGLALLSQRLPDQGALVLLVTDEEATPTGALRGERADLLALLAECPYFEYVITDDRCSFAVFDTHHNELIQVGLIPR